MKVTLIGCGLMGSALAKAMMSAGTELTIVDIDEKAAAPFVEKGATHVETLEEALDSELIYNNVPGHGVFMDILNSLEPGALDGKNVVNTTSSSAKQIEEVAKKVEELGGRYLDATIECYPVSIGTEDGFMFYAGDESIYKKYKELFDAIAGRNFYLGEDVTHPSIMDAAMVNSHYGAMLSTAEGIALCLKHGIDMRDFVKYFDLGATTAMIKSQVKSDLYDYNGEFIDADEATLEIEAAGLEALIGALEDVDVNPEFSEKILELMNRAIERGYGKKNFIAILSVILDQ